MDWQVTESSNIIEWRNATYLDAGYPDWLGLSGKHFLIVTLRWDILLC